MCACLLRYSILQKQAYEIEAMQRLSPVSIDKQLKEREVFEQNMDDALSKCVSTCTHI